MIKRNRTTIHITLLFISLLAITIASSTVSTQSGVVVPPSLLDQVETAGEALVIVGVRASFTPEGDLASPAQAQAQRDSMHAVLDGAVSRAAAAGVVVGQRFETIPFYTARVDAASLPALAALPDTVSIVENRLEAPDLAQSVPLINAPAAWAAGATGAGWTVAVLDTGIDKTHPFLAGKVLSEGCYSNAGGLGHGTSICPGGVTASTAVGSGVSCNSSVGGCSHGTHVAGIAAGANGQGGTHGVAPAAGLIAMQVFTYFEPADCSATATTRCVRSFVSDQVRALERVMALAGPGNANRIAAVNMSLGGGQYFSQAACDSANTGSGRKLAIDNLRSIGIASVTSAGNSGYTDSLGAPGCISTAVSVGSTTKSDAISSFSNRASFLALMAPGSAIVSSVPGNAFSSASGTSMAAPHVAGAWAILKQAVPAASVAQILAAFQATGAVIPDGALTHRRINVTAAGLALVRGASLPGAPRALAATVAGNRVTFNWAPPAGGAPPTHYTLVASLSPGGSPIATVNLPPTATSVPVPNVPPGTYYVRLVAVNGAGAGPSSNQVTVNVAAPQPPGAPTMHAPGVAGRNVTLSWSPPATGGAPLGYNILASPSAGGAPIASINVAAPATSIGISNVPSGTYHVRVRAGNGVGASGFSNEVIVSVP